MRIGILPVGSYEQHGPYLPADTDTRLADALTKEISARVESLVVYPALPYGISLEHAGNAKTTYVGLTSYWPFLASLTESMLREAQLDLLVLVNGHGGNNGALTALEGYVNHQRAGGKLLALHAFQPAARECAQRLFGEFDSHAGSAESSVMAYLDPQISELDLLLDEEAVSFRGSLRFFRSTELATSGIVKRTRRLIISRDKGAELFTAASEALAKEIMLRADQIQRFQRKPCQPQPK